MDEESNDDIGSVVAQQYLSGINYPAKKEDLVNHAKSQNAPQDVIDTLEDLPDREYGGPTDVSSAIGGE
ncbi:MAG TPA: DUF2795 domain-containing protein [Candidatus Paceibacterota bacterium]|jgi:hypothetical protein|nr:DUF2795 domain-containing protein [Candidatus Paceibacterota bacterium]HPI24620.1 DUF2795 domain-containing protein [Candidatus Paceibacterota bacterium]HPN89683.1 DUF2795 domain-containing protein [Candidatus Paceibacterota bacterium]HQB26971.1 DUF2795 domain-containing protein [Candidatus Paceibacterota bacterium]